MNKIRLFIEDREIELQEGVQVAINKQFEELSNPTVICNDFTKTVKIPMTSHNNQIFGHIYSPDKVTVDLPVNYINNAPTDYDGQYDEPLIWITEDLNGLFHNDVSLTTEEGNSEIIWPRSLYNSSWPSNLDDTKTIYRPTTYEVFRGTVDFSYATLSGETFVVDTLTKNEQLLQPTSATGRKEVTFSLNSGMSGDDRTIVIYFDGTLEIIQSGGLHQGQKPWIKIQFSESMPDGDYTLGFNVVRFNTTSGDFHISDISLMKSEEAIWSDELKHHIGIYFDPTLKLDFRLEWNGDMLMRGYAKMLSTTQKDGMGYYEVTLNGELGKVFQELKKLTFDKAAEDDPERKDYFMDKSLIPRNIRKDFFISKDLVYSSWTTDQQWIDIDSPNATITDVIGFAPCNAFDDGFEYDIYQRSTDTKKFTETLDNENNPFSGDTGIAADVVIPDGMTPRGIGEYRSYLQQPYIYFNKLFQIFQKKAEKVTGYKFNLDPQWFDLSNPYWTNIAFMLKKLEVTNSDEGTNEYNASGTSEVEWYSSGENFHYGETRVFPLATSVTNEAFPRYGLYGNDGIYVEENDYYFSNTTTVSFDIMGYEGSAPNPQAPVFFNGDNYLTLRVEFSDIFGDHHINRRVLVYRRDTTNPAILIKVAQATLSDDTTVVAIDATGTTIDTRKGWRIEAELKPFSITQRNIWPPCFCVAVGAVWGYNNVNPIRTGTASTTINAKLNALDLNFSLRKDFHRSYMPFTLSDLWNNDYNLFDQILNYCKMYRIFIICDEHNKELKFIQSHKYFENYTVTDWTDKICMDEDFVVKPISWENKYILFNYEDSKTKLGEEYREENGADWGEKRLITDYNFNTNTDNLFSGITPSLINTNNVLSWTTLYDNHKINYIFPAEYSIHMADKDGKYVDQFGGWYFVRPVTQFDTSSGMRSVHLSDDTEFQLNNNTYCYSQSADGIEVETYPKLDIVDYTGNMCIFGVPTRNYTYNTTAYTNAHAIYDVAWKKYVNERYNKNNKVITCYVYMTPSDFIDFDFNHFVKIGNQLCMVNKIYDFDAISNKKVKVDLITIQNLEGYTTR